MIKPAFLLLGAGARTSAAVRAVAEPNTVAPAQAHDVAKMRQEILRLLTTRPDRPDIIELAHFAAASLAAAALGTWAVCTIHPWSHYNIPWTLGMLFGLSDLCGRGHRMRGVSTLILTHIIASKAGVDFAHCAVGTVNMFIALAAVTVVLVLGTVGIARWHDGAERRALGWREYHEALLRAVLAYEAQQSQQHEQI